MATPEGTGIFPPPTVLVVDDEAEICGLLKRGLERLCPGTRVVTAPCGEAAIEILKDNEIDLVVTDYKMPGMTGLDLLKWARVHVPHTGRILMTGHAEMSMAISVTNEGKVAKFLTKPFSVGAAAGILRETLEKHRAERLRRKAFERTRTVIAPRTSHPGGP